jgi:hypothetical protein
MSRTVILEYGISTKYGSSGLHRRKKEKFILYQFFVLENSICSENYSF